MSLRRSVSTIGLLATSLSCMIGSGWLFGAHYAARIAGPASIISWVVGGVMIIFIALTFSELSTMLPVPGGLARFTQLTHGTLVSFCMSWLAWLSCVAVAPTEVQAILQYSTRYYPWLTHTVQDVHLLTTPGFIVACILLLIITIMNIMGVKALTRYNTVITSWKLLVPIVTVLALITHRFEFHPMHSYAHFAPYGIHGILWALPSAGIVFSFLGFREATSLAGEARKPHIAIPLAVIGSVVICTILYILIQLAFIGALTPKMLLHGWAHLQFQDDTGPFAGIAATLGLGWLVLLIYADSLASPFGTGLIYTATTARLNYAMSQNHYTPAVFLKLNSSGVPAHAIFFNFIVGLFMFLPFKGWQALVSFQSLAIVLAYSTGPISLLALRRQQPDLHRPFKLPAKYLFASITFYICNLITYWTGWEIMWRLMLAILFGIATLLGYLYWCIRANTASHDALENLDTANSIVNNHRIFDLHLRASWWLIPYFGGLTLISYLGNFGGGLGLITFGWDFALIGVFSLLTLGLAHYSRLPNEINAPLVTASLQE